MNPLPPSNWNRDRTVDFEDASAFERRWGDIRREGEGKKTSGERNLRTRIAPFGIPK